MVYVPTKIITLTNRRIRESSDLSVPVSSLVGKSAYLAVTKNKAIYVIDINQALLYNPTVVLTSPVNTAFSGLLTDLFVTTYQVSGIPLLNTHGVYDKRLRVFSANAYKTYKVQFTSVNTPSIVDDATQKGYLDDLVITGPDDLSNMLVAVNGVFHRTSLFEDKLYVLDGFRTCRLTGRRDVCLVDTSQLGGHTVVPLTTNNVSSFAYNQIAKINAGTSLYNKTVFLVVDGYFYHLDTDVLFILDSTHVGVRTERLSLVQQFRHNPRTMTRKDVYGQDAAQTSRKYSDAYASLFIGNRSIPTTTFQTAAFQMSRLAHYHSFLVIVNSPGVFFNPTTLVPTGTPQYYDEPSSKIVSGMMQYGCGLTPSYVIQKDPQGSKAIFIDAQDNDADLYLESINPGFIPALIPDPIGSASLCARLVDYVSA